MTEQPTFEKYRSLVPKIARRRFSRLLNYNAGCVGFDDLLQEGYLALLLSLGTYRADHESRAKFFTYAYSAIFRAMAHYLEQHSSPVTGGRAFNAKRCSEKLKEQYGRATQRTMLSELNFEEWESAVMDTHDPEERYDTFDFLCHCLEELADRLPPDELAVVTMRAYGASIREIGEMIGMSRRHTSRLVRRLHVKAAGILQKEM